MKINIDSDVLALAKERDELQKEINELQIKIESINHKIEETYKSKKMDLYNSISSMKDHWILCPLSTLQNSEYNYLMKVEDVKLESKYGDSFITIIGKQLLFRGYDDMLFTPCGEHSVDKEIIDLIVCLSQEEADNYLDKLTNLKDISSFMFKMISADMQTTIKLHRNKNN